MNTQHLQICLEALDLAHRSVANQLAQVGITNGEEGRTKLQQIEAAFAAVQAELTKDNS